MYCAGIDAGSNTIKAAILKDQEIVSFHVIKTGLGGEEQASLCLAEACTRGGINREDITGVFGTGYGREYLISVKERKSEIMCLAAGIHCSGNKRPSLFSPCIYFIFINYVFGCPGAVS